MSRKRWWIIIPLVLVILYLLGPNPDTPVISDTWPTIKLNTGEIEQYIQKKESQHHLRKDNQARIIWADSSKRITEYSILYLHGFSASQAEGQPVHQTIARRFGCNLYLSRLAEHGVDTTEQLANLTADALWESAKESFEIASRIGKKVIVMGTSTGGTLGLMLAARRSDLHSLILLSPNIEIFDDNAWVLNNPWGLQVARMITGSDYVFSADTRPIYKQYWNYGYRLRAVVELQELLENEMKPELFQRISQPALMLYYYKDDVHQDSVVKVDAMLRMFDQLGTSADKKKAVSMPQAGNHVLGSYIKSKDVDGVVREIEKFMTETLHLEKQ